MQGTEKPLPHKQASKQTNEQKTKCTAQSVCARTHPVLVPALAFEFLFEKKCLRAKGAAGVFAAIAILEGGETKP